MAVNELDLTVIGWVGSEPVCFRGDDGQVPFTRFRLASTPRVYDREHDAYVDGLTSWFTVKAFRHLARNVAESVRRGDPVLVHGRLAVTEWAAADGTVRTTAELTADAVGHDLSRGTTRFARTVHEVPGAGGVPGAAPGGPGAHTPGASRVDGGGGPDGVGDSAATAGLPDLTGAEVLEDDAVEADPAPAA
jgi:single-strand DNA-binding protein